MMTRNNGGPAFPRTVQHNNWQLEGKDGMSLRDWFAGQALAGITANQSYTERADNFMARWAYGLADAMLLERGSQ